jgi:choline-sulfatase
VSDTEKQNVSRRRFLKTGAGAAASAGLAPLLAGAERPGRDRPNIILIITDQQHARMLSCAGNEHLDTPAMDSLARTGTRFEQAYCGDPVCLPSRYSMMTGLLPSAGGYTDNASGRRHTVPDEVLKQGLGWRMREAGYETAYGGKVHLPKGMNPENIGFSFFCRNQRDGLAREAADFIRAEHDRPFFLVTSFINPHDICYMAIRDHAGKDYDKLKLGEAVRRPEGVSEAEFYSGHCPPLPENYEIPPGEPEAIKKLIRGRPFQQHTRDDWGERKWRLHRWAYCRLTEIVDRQVGVVLDALRESGREEDTVVVFTSDHGDQDASHRLEHKMVLYEESANIPLIISQKGTTPAGHVDRSHLVSNGLDLMPTLCDYAGVEPPEGRQGSSLRPLAENRGAKWRDQVVCESVVGRMVRTERFKYCVYESGANRETLIDLEKDPGEMNNLAEKAAYRDVLNAHRRRMSRWIGRAGDKIGAEYVVSPE